MKNIFVSGSLAFDRVKTYPGQFSDLLLPEHLSHLSVSIVVDSLVQHDGGVAANIAFSLAQLGERAIIVSAAGSDFEEYKKRLATFADVSKIVINEKELTAAADIVTDSAQNQITTFFPGALHTPCFVDVSMADLVLVSAGNRDDMVRLPIECRTKNIPFFLTQGK
jgi:adenosine kinase